MSRERERVTTGPELKFPLPENSVSYHVAQKKLAKATRHLQLVPSLPSTASIGGAKTNECVPSTNTEAKDSEQEQRQSVTKYWDEYLRSISESMGQNVRFRLKEGSYQPARSESIQGEIFCIPNQAIHTSSCDESIVNWIHAISHVSSSTTLVDKALDQSKAYFSKIADWVNTGLNTTLVFQCIKETDEIQARTKQELLDTIGQLSTAIEEDASQLESVSRCREIVEERPLASCAAFNEIFEIGDADPYAVSTLLMQLPIESHGEGRSAVVRILLKGLQHNSDYIRDGAAVGLSLIKDPSLLPQIKQQHLNEQNFVIKNRLQALISKLEKK